MAPEIKKGMVYNGVEVDVFSLGVVIFSMVHGLFPFQEARRTDQWYGMLVKKQYDRYFMSVDRKRTLSDEFKELILKTFSEDGSQRPSLEQIRDHPWMTCEQEEENQIRESMCMELLGQKLAPPSPLPENYEANSVIKSTPRTFMI